MRYAWRAVCADVLRHRLPGSEPGVELSLLEWRGEGPPALFHHANGFCGALWAPVVEPLLPRLHAFALDARGHGASSKPAGDDAYAWERLAADLVCAAEFVCERTGQPAIDLGVGHSFGGTLTMTAAAERPGLYCRALLIDPVILPPLDTPERAARNRGNPMAERARKRRHRWQDRAEARAFFAGKPLFADWTARALEIYTDEGLVDADGGVELACPGRVEGAVFAGATDFDPYDYAGRADLPLRIERATHGDFPRESYERLVERLPHGELGEITGGHLVVMERPEDVARSISTWLDRSSAP